MDKIVKDIYYILTDSNNPAHKYFPNNAEIFKLAHYLVSKGVALKSKNISICPVCNGKGFVSASFYDQPGSSISYAGYINMQQKTRLCLSCMGTGTIERKED